MTYDEILTKYIRKLGRDITAGEVVHDLRQMREKGRWMSSHTEYNEQDLVYCSECGWTRHVKEHREYKYCPNCGSWMDGTPKHDRRVRSKTDFRQALYAKEIGFNLHDTMIWQKDGFTAVGALVSRYAPVFEYIFIFSKGTPKTFNPIKDRLNIWAGRKNTGTLREPDGTTRAKSTLNKTLEEYGVRYNVWKINVDHTRETDHPAVFPKRLVRDLMVSWSNEGDTVLDPFLGSGTTRLVAYDNGRDFIGYEISEQYFKAEEERFSVHTSQMSLFGGLDDGLS